MKTKYNILKHKSENWLGFIKNNTLYRQGTGVTPQLFPHHWDIELISKSIKWNEDPNYTIDKFKLIEVTLTI